MTPQPKANVLQTYLARVRLFHPNARLYLASAILTGAALGVYRLLFNFFALSLGLNESIIGQLITINGTSALLAALPMGYLADLLGRKNALILSSAAVSLAIGAMVLWPHAWLLYTMNILMGIAQSLATVTMSPFLIENSGQEERTYLFSLSSGLQMAAAFMGNSIGGHLPTWIGEARGISATSTTAYAGALGIIAAIAGIGLIPFFFIHAPRLQPTERTSFAPFAYAVKNPAKLGKLVAPMLVTSIGAGLFMPFINIFFRVVYHQPDPVIGTVLAWGSLAMGIGLIIAPPLADKMGKIQFVVITQGISIPFLVMLGYAPWFWMSALAHYVRLALMNMGGPVYQTFVMESVEPSARATVASLVSMAWNFGWAISPSISGWLQVRYGFGPVFLGVIILYVVAVFMYWKFFWNAKADQASVPVSAD